MNIRLDHLVGKTTVYSRGEVSHALGVVHVDHVDVDELDKKISAVRPLEFLPTQEADGRPWLDAGCTPTQEFAQRASQHG